MKTACTDYWITGGTMHVFYTQFFLCSWRGHRQYVVMCKRPPRTSPAVCRHAYRSQGHAKPYYWYMYMYIDSYSARIKPRDCVVWGTLRMYGHYKGHFLQLLMSISASLFSEAHQPKHVVRLHANFSYEVVQCKMYAFPEWSGISDAHA